MEEAREHIPTVGGKDHCQYDQIGRIFQSSLDKICYKNKQKCMVTFLGYFENWHFLENILEKLCYFLLQHLVTLITVQTVCLVWL